MNALTSIHVGMAEWVVSDDVGSVFVVPGLGSCIGIALYDPNRPIAGMSHIMLPDSRISRDGSKAGKYADTAIPLLVEELVARGVKRSALVAKIAGGSQMFSIKGSLNIGERNILAVTEVLKSLNIPLVGNHVGGTVGRTVRFFLETHRFTVRSLGKTEVDI